MNKLKGGASVFLCLLLIAATMPSGVFAEENGDAFAQGSAGQIGMYYEVNDHTGEISGENAALSAGETQQSCADGQIMVNKTIRGTDRENVFDIDLEVITKDKMKTETLTEDAAVVLIMDTSESMNQFIGGRNQYRRIDKAKEAAQTFINGFVSENPQVQRKIAIVNFSKYAATAQPWENASALAQTGDAGSRQCEALKHLRAYEGTNMEAGLRAAKALLAAPEISGIQNKSIILLSDGVPTYYVKANGETGGNGGETSHECHSNVEQFMKNELGDISRYAVYIGEKDYSGRYASIYCEGRGRCSLYMEVPDWIRSSCQAVTFAAEEAADLVQAFQQISRLIMLQAQAYILTDPMGANMQLLTDTLEDDTGILQESKTKKGFQWDLKQVIPEKLGKEGYVYRLTYSVRLSNLEEGVNADNFCPANGVTELTYLIVEEGKEAEAELQRAYCNIPSVKGLEGSFAFTKVDASGNPLAGARFILTAEDDEGFTMEAASDAEGHVSFGDIPSGHTYTLSESQAPAGYIRDVARRTVTVAYGQTDQSAIPEGKIVNMPESTSETIDVTVHKIWGDNHDQAGKRPESIQIQLYAGGEAYGEAATLTAPKMPPPLPSVDAGPVTGEEPEADEAPVIDEAPIAGEESVTGEESLTDEEPTASMKSVTGEEPVTDEEPVTGEEPAAETDPAAAEDEEAEPAEVPVEVVVSEVPVEVVVSEVPVEAVVSEVPVSETPKSDVWNHTWTNLPKYIDGKEAVYTVEETTVPGGYTSAITGDFKTGITIVNQYAPTPPETMQVRIEKTWNDQNNFDNLRPTSVSIDVKNGGETVRTVTLSAQNHWADVVELNKSNENGEQLVYTVEELSVPKGYSDSVTGSCSDGQTVTVTNTHTSASVPVLPPVPVKTVNITVHKIWADAGNQDKRPEFLRVTVKNGDNTVRTLTLSEETGWTAQVALDKFNKNGSRNMYTASEETVADYIAETAMVSDDHGNVTITLTNTYSPVLPPIIVDPEDPSEPEPGEEPGAVIDDEGAPTDGAEPEQDQVMPKTGDSASAVMWLGLTLLAMGGLLRLRLYRKKEK